MLTVISLWQPWASLLFTRHKRHETRSFPLPEKLIGQEIAVHATLNFPAPNLIHPDVQKLCRNLFGEDYRETLPRGAILGTLYLMDSQPAENVVTDGIDHMCGDWTAGRFVWRVSQPKLYSSPIPMKGRQGWWKAEVESLR